VAVDVRGRVALVTGANRGLGFEVCRSLASEGARVILTARDSAKAEAAAKQLRDEGLDVVARQLEVTDQGSVDGLAAWVESDIGRLDILVNNAGIMPNKKDVLEASLAEVEEMWQVNTLGPWRTSLALAHLMVRDGWGRIVNVSSEAASMHRMTGTAAAYRVSKVALNGFTRILASQLKPDGILVNAVCPGWVRTDMGGPDALRSLEDGAASIVWAARLDDDGPTGGFYQDGKELPW
jgi:NAD(P)-dependent dehydrogenase (short-subunit alcohol dehydrogenase family)